MVKILTIAGSDSSGGAGIQADLKTITVLGGYGASVITAITAQNTLGVQGIFNVPIEGIALQLDSVCSDIQFDSIKIGMLSNANIIKLIAEKIDQYQLEHIVLDPVMVATSGDILLEMGAIEALKEYLIPRATLITPNIDEAQLLTGSNITNVMEMEQAAIVLNKMGARQVLVKGGHLADTAIDVLYDGLNFFHFEQQRIHTENTHGTGCTLSAAIATGLAQGISIEQAVQQAKEYLTIALKMGATEKIGQGRGPVKHNYMLVGT